MPNRVAVSTLNASTVDILNTIRANASREYQELVPEIDQATDIPRVGEVLQGYPALANQFLTALVNRIALVRVKSATFNNAYKMFKKGFLEYGETVEEVFVGILNAVEYDAEKAEKREFKRTLPDVRSAFHIMNWRVLYPVTIQQQDLDRAFLSAEGVQDLIARIVDSIYTAAEYDEFLLFKYLLIKAVAHGKMYPVAIDGDEKNAAIAFRGTSNSLPFMSKAYNEAGVRTTTPKDRQYIFMDAKYNASYDVNVLASAFNMDKADFMGRLVLIDNFADFDNERFETIRANSDMIEEVTGAELAIMKNVKAILVDGDWFQVYDNLAMFKEKEVASGLYWNYFYHTWKTISYSPFANAVVFVDSAQSTALPATVKYVISDISKSDYATVVTFEEDDSTPTAAHSAAQFIQDEQATTDGIAVHRYGAYIIPKGKDTFTPSLEIDGTVYQGTEVTASEATVGTVITFTKQ